jgi:hypothetical protein
VKAVLTLCLILLMTAGAVAQKAKSHVQIECPKVDLVLVVRPVVPFNTQQDQKAAAKSVARLYRFKHARIKAELSFRTQRHNLTV